MNAYQEVERLLAQISVAVNNPAIAKASEQISVLCRAHMLDTGDEISQSLGLRKNKAKIFNLLLARRGRIVSRQALMDVCYPSGSEPDIKIIDVQMSHIRDKLEGTQYSIETVWGVGYRMAPAHA